MIPRGEVGLIFATIGLREAILDQEQYAALLLVVLATTLIAPPLLRWRLQQIRAGRPQRRHPSTAPPGGRWLVTRDGVVDLAGSPPEGLALSLALEAAQAISRGDVQPGRSAARLPRRSRRRADAMGPRGDPAAVRGAAHRRRPIVAVPRDDGRARARASRARRGRPPPPRRSVRDRPVARPAVLARRHDPRSRSRRRTRRGRVRAAAASRVAAARGADPRHGRRGRRPSTSPAGWRGGSTSGPPPSRRSRCWLGTRACCAPPPSGSTASTRSGCSRSPPTSTVPSAPGPCTCSPSPSAGSSRGTGPASTSCTISSSPRSSSRTSPGSTPATSSSGGAPKRCASPATTGPSPNASRHAPRTYLLAQDAADVARQAALLEPLPSRDGPRRGSQLEVTDEWRVEVASRDPRVAGDRLGCAVGRRAERGGRGRRHVGRRRRARVVPRAAHEAEPPDADG